MARRNIVRNIVRSVGVTPYFTTDDEEIYYLLGKEAFAPGYTNSNKWGNFSGRPTSNYLMGNIESAYNDALSEFYEESLGLFGSKETLKERIPINEFVISDNSAYTFMMELNEKDGLDYLSKTYTNVYNMLHAHGKWIKEKKFEPSLNKWFTYDKYAIDCPGLKDILEKKEIKFFTFKNGQLIPGNEPFKQHTINTMKLCENFIRTKINKAKESHEREEEEEEFVDLDF